MAPNAVHAKDAILDAARELVLKRGVQHATVSAISRRERGAGWDRYTITSAPATTLSRSCGRGAACQEMSK